jgi:hypothetical protein
MIEDINSYLSKVVDDLDKIVYYLSLHEEKTREQDIAMQKLQEAIFWLTFGIDNMEEIK